MADTNVCCCGGENVLLFACSGASNVGQLANNVALQLAKNGLGSMSCIAAIGAHLDGFVVSARDCDRLVVLDGCDKNCALLTFKQVHTEPHIHVTLTEQGIEKKHDENSGEEDFLRAYTLVANLMKGESCSTNL
jgi:uncharacterized metal-binding protein